MIDTRAFLVDLLDSLAILPAAAMCFYPMQDQLAVSRKRIIFNGLLLFIVTLPVSSLITAYFHIDGNLAFFPLLAVFFLFYHRCLTVHISRSLAVFTWVIALMAILSNISTGIDALKNPALGSADVTMERALSGIVLAVIAALVSVIPAKKYCTKLINSLTMQKVWYITVPVTGIIMLINMMFRPQKYETLYVNKVFIAFWAGVLLTLAALILLTVIFYYIVMGMIDMMSTEERNSILEMQESRYIKQQRYIEDTAKIRHDFKHTIRTLCELSNAGEYDELKRYLSQYLVEMPQNDTIYYCKENSINAVLNYYTDQALAADIELTMRIELPETLPFSDIDMCGMIGNVLDNAITACREIPADERRLQFTMMTQNNAQLIIVSSNSFNGKIKRQGDAYLSTNRRGSGIGLTSISTTAKRCGGEARFSHDSAKKEFYIDIMIPLKKSE